ncbi:MAG: transposase [Methanobrevibacter sp.]|nr:transposase [Candidatus Methanovirga aequatorialis]
MNTLKKYANNPGCKAYPREMLCRIVVMAFTDGITSAKKISRLANENLTYIYLARRDTPKYHTISDFKSECSELIEDIIVLTIAMAKESGMVTLNTIALDGTTIKANASSNSSVDENAVKLTRKYLKESQETDEEEK